MVLYSDHRFREFRPWKTRPFSVFTIRISRGCIHRRSFTVGVRKKIQFRKGVLQSTPINVDVLRFVFELKGVAVVFGYFCMR